MKARVPNASARTVAGAVGVSTLAQVVAKLAHFALNIVASLALIRYFGPAGYGDYVFVFSFAALFGIVSDLGLTKVAVRDMSRYAESTPAVLGTTIAARLGLAMLCWGVAQAAITLIGVRPDLRLAVAVASLLFVAEAGLSVTAIFQVRLAMQYDAVVTLVVQGLDTVAILVLIGMKASLLAILAAPTVATAFGIALSAWLVRRRFPTAARVDASRIVPLLRDAVPLGVATILAFVLVKADGVLLGILATPEDVGYYGAAYKPIEYLFLTLAVVVNVLFPLLARYHGSDRRRFETVYRRGAEVLLAATLPIAVVTYFVADPLVRTLYAPAFASSAAPLRILAVALIFMLLAAWQGFALVSGGHQRLLLVANAVAVAVNLSLNFALIPSFGYMGAAVAALSSSTFVGICTAALAERTLRISLDLGRLARLAGANLALGVALWALLAAGVPWLAAAGAACAAYAACLLLLGVTTVGELRLLLPARPAAVSAEARS